MKAKIFLTFSVFSLNVFCLYLYAYIVTIVNFYDMVLMFLLALIATILLLIVLEKEIAKEIDLNGNKPFLVSGIVLFLLLTAPIIFFSNGDKKEPSYEIWDYDRDKDIIFYFNDKQLKNGLKRYNQITEQE